MNHKLLCVFSCPTFFGKQEQDLAVDQTYLLSFLSEAPLDVFAPSAIPHVRRKILCLCCEGQHLSLRTCDVLCDYAPSRKHCPVTNT